MILTIQIDNGNSWMEFATFIVSLITTLIAVKALYIWRAEKKHDIHIKSLSNSRLSFQMIKHLRMPISSLGEIDEFQYEKFKKIKNGLPITHEDEAYLIFQSRMKRYEKLYSEILNLRETLWASFDENHPFIKYYDFILNTIVNIENAHSRLIFLSNESDNTKREVKPHVIEARSVIYEMSGDQTSITLENLYNKVVDERKIGRIWRLFK